MFATRYLITYNTLLDQFTGGENVNNYGIQLTTPTEAMALDANQIPEAKRLAAEIRKQLLKCASVGQMRVDIGSLEEIFAAANQECPSSPDESKVLKTLLHLYVTEGEWGEARVEDVDGVLRLVFYS